MARQRKLSPERKAFINSLIEHYRPEDTSDVQGMLKDLLAIPCRACRKQQKDSHFFLVFFKGIISNNF